MQMVDLANSINNNMDRLKIGSNNPPSDIEWLGENLILKHVHIVRAAEGHIELANNIPPAFTEENEAAWTGDFIKLMENCTKELERRRKEEKEPFLRQGQYVDTFFGDLKEKLSIAIEKAKKPLNDWLIAKAKAEQAARDADARLLREQQEAAMKAAAESTINPDIDRVAAIDNAVAITEQVKVAEAIAAAPVVSMARTTGTSSTAGLQTKWVGTIKNIDELDLTKLRPYISATELQKALDRYVKQGGRQCEGAEIKEIMEAKVK